MSKGQYYQFTLAAIPGKKLALTGLSFRPFFQDTTQPVGAGLAYSTDGTNFTTLSVTPGTPASSTGATSNLWSADLSGVAALQNTTATITFRVYLYGEGAYQLSGLGGAGNDLAVTGSFSSTGTGAAPAAPALNGATAADSQVALTWAAASGATGYTVRYGTSAGNYTSSIDVGNVTSRTVTGLTNGTTYYFAVQAYNGNGTSANSNELSATPTAVPGAPTLNSATAGDTQVALGWSAVTGATGYVVKYGTASGNYTTSIDVGNVVSRTVTGLTNGTTYYFTVSAYNGSGSSGNATERSAAPRAIPGAPTLNGATAGDSQVALTWGAVNGADGYVVKYGTTSGSYTTTIDVGNVVSRTVTGLTNGTNYYFVVSAYNTSGSSANSAERSAAPAGPALGGLPANWTDSDIGFPGQAGAAGVTNGTWTVRGGGWDVWGTYDGFNYASQAYNGDLIVVAKVTSLTNTDPWAKAGLMVRNGTAPGATFADVVLTPTNGVAFQYRNATDGQSNGTTVTGVTGPVWLKLVRSGNSFSGYYSTNGTTWAQIGTTQAITMPASVRAGLMVTAHNNSALATATFTNVAVTDQLAGGDVGTPVVAGGQSYNAATNTWTVSSMSRDIAGAIDQFRFASKTYVGDGELYARVTSLTNTNAQAKAGVMWRNGAAANGMFMDVVVTPASGVVMQWRAATGGLVSQTVVSGVAAASATHPVWVRIVRSGTSFTGYYAETVGMPTAADWHQVGTAHTVALPTSALVGLAVTSKNLAATATATFTDVDPHPLAEAAPAAAVNPVDRLFANLGGAVPSPVRLAAQALHNAPAATVEPATKRLDLAAGLSQAAGLPQTPKRLAGAAKVALDLNLLGGLGWELFGK
jgi:uncharacterized protein YccT (UPF0319 family)